MICSLPGVQESIEHRKEVAPANKMSNNYIIEVHGRTITKFGARILTPQARENLFFSDLEPFRLHFCPQAQLRQHGRQMTSELHRMEPKMQMWKQTEAQIHTKTNHGWHLARNQESLHQGRRFSRNRKDFAPANHMPQKTDNLSAWSENHRIRGEY